MSQEEQVAFISSIGGKWDLNVDFFAKNAIEFDALLNEILRKFPKQLSNYDIIIKIEAYQYVRDYLYNKIMPNGMHTAGKI